MKIESFKKINENHVALAVTCVLFFLLFVLKTQETQVSIQKVITSSEIELASSMGLD